GADGCSSDSLVAAAKSMAGDGRRASARFCCSWYREYPARPTESAKGAAARSVVHPTAKAAASMISERRLMVMLRWEIVPERPRSRGCLHTVKPNATLVR